MPEKLQEAYIKGSLPWIRAEARKILTARGQDLWISEMMPDALIAEDGPGTQVWRIPFTFDGAGQLQLGDPAPFDLVLQPATRMQAIVQEAMDTLQRFARRMTGGPEDVPLTESYHARLVEATTPAAGRRFLKADGTLDLVLVKAGRGNPADNHYYPPATLARDHKVFEGGKMCWDHPDALEEVATGGVRKVEDLAARINTTWFNEATQEIWGNVRPIDTEAADFLEEAGDMIEVSINALGQARYGTAPDGQSAKIVEKIARGTADFVTQAGAGGRLVPLFEAFRTKTAQRGEDSVDLKNMTLAQLREARPDLFPGGAPAPTGDLAAIMTEVTAMKEANSKLSTQVVALLAEKDQATLLVESQKAVAVAITAEKLPLFAVSRLTESFAGRSFLKEGKADAEAAAAAVKAAAATERAYIAQIAEAAGGRPLEGFGPSGTPIGGGDDPVKLAEKAASLRESMFIDMGYAPEVAKRMAADK